MTWMFVADSEYAVINAEQWEQLDTALDVADIERARELWLSWRAPSWPENSPVAESASLALDGSDTGDSDRGPK